MIDQINELPDDGLKSSPETSGKYMVSRKIKEVALLTPYSFLDSSNQFFAVVTS